MADNEGTAGANRVDEERMGAVEGVDEAGVWGKGSPAAGLDSSGDFEGQFIKMPFPRILWDSFFTHQAQQIPVCADIVKSMIMDARVSEVRGHARQRRLAAEFQAVRIPGCIKLKDGGTELETLRPLRPASARVASVGREDRGALAALV